MLVRVRVRADPVRAQAPRLALAQAQPPLPPLVTPWMTAKTETRQSWWALYPATCANAGSWGVE
jgi:hypothetical protein